MTTTVLHLPPVVVFALAVATVCFLAAWIVALSALGRWLGRRDVRRARGPAELEVKPGAGLSVVERPDDFGFGELLDWEDRGRRPFTDARADDRAVARLLRDIERAGDRP